MLKVSFPDGAIKQYDKGITPFEIAESISNSLSKKLLVLHIMENKLNLLPN